MEREFNRIRAAAQARPLTSAHGMLDAHFAMLPGGIKIALTINK